MSLSHQPKNLKDEYNRHSLPSQMTVQQTVVGSGRRWERNTRNGAQIWKPFPVMTDEVT